MDEEEGKQADEINKLTGKPLAEDVLLYAIPVCGPYSAIRSFKYSVKLTPGTMKKGNHCVLPYVSLPYFSLLTALFHHFLHRTFHHKHEILFTQNTQIVRYIKQLVSSLYLLSFFIYICRTHI